MSHHIHILLLITLSCAAACAQTTIHVDQGSGSDMDDGLTPGTAVATVCHGASLLGPSGTLMIGPGLYTPTAGETYPASAAGDITFIGSGSATTILDGEMLSQVLSLNGTAIHIEGLTVQNGDSGIGGGIFIGQPMTLDLVDVAVLDNNASIGAGLHVQMNTLGTACTVTDCRFERNTAGIGAGIQYQINTDEPASLIMTNSTFVQNVASIGGAVQFQENGLGRHDLEAHSCVYDGSLGRAIHFQRTAGTAFGVITNSFFTGNDTALDASDTTLSVVNSTFTGNQTALTATNSVDTDVSNTILWNNGTELSASGVATICFSILEGLAYGGFSDLGNNLDQDPLLTMDGHLVAGSPAIDHGANPAATGRGLTEDIDGDPRFVDDPSTPNGPAGEIDIGIDEFDPPPACFGICGDCDENAIGPDVLDALLAAQLAAAIFVPTVQQTFCCDVDSSSTITVIDALLIAQDAVTLPVSLTCM